MASYQSTKTNSASIHQLRSRPMSVVLTLLVLSVFINYVDRGNLSIAAPLLKNELGISASQLEFCFHLFSGPTRRCCLSAAGLWTALTSIECWPWGS